MAQVSFKEGLKANLPKSDISQGALYLTTDTGELYFGKNTNTLLKITDTDKATNTQLDDAVDILNTKLDTKLSLSGGDMSGHIYLTGSKEASSTNNTSQLIFGTRDNEHVAISSNNNALVINPTSSSTANQIVLYLEQQSSFPKGITAGNGKVTSSVSSATASAAGLIKVSSVNSAAVTVNSESTTTGRYYPIELNNDGKAIVNIPWTDTTYTLSSFGITASATEINILDGITATTAELNYVDGVTSAIQTQLNGKAPTSHASTETTYGVSSTSNYGHAMASSTTPKANGTAKVGSETAKFARGDHVHPLQTTVSGNAGSATKLATARTINGVSFDGTINIETPSATVGTINLTAVGWTLDSTLGLYKQTAVITGLTAKHKVDLDADYNTISVLNDNIVPYNENGTFYAVTKIPPNVDIAIQYSLILTK